MFDIKKNMEIPEKVNEPAVLEIIEGLLDLCVDREKEIAELTFELETLKRKLESTELDKAIEAESLNPYIGRNEVLIADAAEFSRKHLADILTANGYSIVGCAKTGKEAIDMFYDSSPALVAVDSHLPGIDGLQAIREMKNFDPDLKVIMLSRNRDRHMVIEAITVGVEDYICKPVQDKRFLDAVEKLLQFTGDIG